MKVSANSNFVKKKFSQSKFFAPFSPKKTAVQGAAYHSGVLLSVFENEHMVYFFGPYYYALSVSFAGERLICSSY